MATQSQMDKLVYRLQQTLAPVVNRADDFDAFIAQFTADARLVLKYDRSADYADRLAAEQAASRLTWIKEWNGVRAHDEDAYYPPADIPDPE